jgi:hypothetical protein
MAPLQVATDDEIAAHMAAGNDVAVFRKPPETAPVEEQPAPIVIVPERVEGPAPAVVEEAPAIPPDLLLWFYNAFWCQCGSRAFEQRQCCDIPMRPVRVEIHAREVSDG